MQVYIEFISHWTTVEVDEGNHVSTGLKVSIEPLSSENFELAEVCDGKQGIEVEVSWHNQAGTTPKWHQVRMPMSSVSMREGPISLSSECERQPIYREQQKSVYCKQYITTILLVCQF